jgi:hypothetical protein
MRNKQILAEEVLNKVIKLDVLGTQSISRRNTTDTSQLMHILPFISIVPTSHRNQQEGLTTKVQLPANQVCFLPLINIIPGTTLA